MTYAIFDPANLHGADCNTYYGGYRTRTFAEIFPSYSEFAADLDSTEIPLSLTEEDLTITYYALYSRYGNSHIINSDENQFLYRLVMNIFQYAPTWLKRLSIQEEIRTLSLEELRRGSRAVYNHSYNPDTAPSTASLQELPTIDSQNTTNYEKSIAEAYATLSALLETDMTEDFLIKFRPLFIKVLAPDYALTYEIPELSN